MPLEVRHSTSSRRLIQDLVRSLGESLRNQEDGRPLPVLIPSVPVRERVKVAMARQLGLAMGVELLLPGAFFGRLAERLDLPPLDPRWSPEGLFWALLPLVQKLVRRPDSPLSGLQKGEAAEVELCRSLADAFDQYVHYRPEMVADWDRGRPWENLDPRHRRHEDWQRELWMELRKSIGLQVPHLGQRYAQLLERLAQPGASLPFENLEVLSTGSLPRGTLALLAALGKRLPVRLRQLAPSRHLYNEFRSRQEQWRAGQAFDRILEGNPLLSSLGREARGNLENFFDIMGPEDNFDSLDEDAESAKSPSGLLQALQTDILEAQQPGEGEPRAAVSADETLKVHRVHGAQRGVEVLRDELLRAFHDIKGLKAEDVLILCPSLGEYAALALSLCGDEQYDLPLALVESEGEVEDPLLAAVLGLLRFSAGRAGLLEGQAFLSSPAVVQELGQEAAEELAEQAEQAGVTFGLDEDHRAALQAGSAREGTWAAGLDRLLDGLYLGNSAEVTAELPGYCLPLADELSSGRDALPGLRFLRLALGFASAWRQPASPGVWAQRLREAAEALFADEKLERQALGLALSWLDRAGAHWEGAADLGPAAVAGQLEQLNERRRKVDRTEGRIALGGVKPLAGLPAKVVVMLGLDAGFPRQGGAPAWNLMACSFRAGDRDARNEDRQCFLDALLAAEQRFIVIAPVRDAVNNAELPQSSCVDELLRTAAETAGGTEGLTLDHPLHPYVRSAFEGRGSWDALAREAGTAAEGEGRSARFFEPGSAPTKAAPAPKAEALPELSELLRVLESPAKAWLEALDVRQPRLEAGAAPEDENLDMSDNLRRWQAKDYELQALLFRGQGAGSPARRRAALRYQRLLAPAELGEAQDRAELEPLRAALSPLAQGPALRRQGVELPGLLRAELLFQGEPQDPAAPLLFVSASKSGKAKTKLRSWYHACVASLSRKQVGGVLDRYADSEDGFQNERFPLPSPAEAEKALKLLVELAQRARREPLPMEPEQGLKRAKPLWADARARKLNPEAEPKAPRLTEEEWRKLTGGEEEEEGEESGQETKFKDAEFELAWRGQEAWGGQPQAWDELALALWEPVLAWEEGKLPPGGAGA